MRADRSVSPIVHHQRWGAGSDIRLRARRVSPRIEWSRAIEVDHSKTRQPMRVITTVERLDEFLNSFVECGGVVGQAPALSVQEGVAGSWWHVPYYAK